MQDYSGYGQPPAGDGGFGGPTSPFPQGPPPPPPPIGAVPAARLPSSSPAPITPGIAPGTSAAEAAVLKKVEPSLVIINTTLQYSSEEAAGTGMVLNSSGLILTNNHLIENAP